MTDLRFLDAAARQAQVADDLANRPWPLPDGPWQQAQTRDDTLLAHWQVEPSELARLLPPELPLDTFAGDAWLGIVPFRLENLRLRGLPPVPGLSSFLQLDVRTYVTFDGRPGIWLFSLDTTNPLLVEAAKRAHRLPAYRARMSAEQDGAGLRFEAVRDRLEFSARYAGTGEPFTPVPGTFEHFVTERFCLYTADGGRLYRADLHHSGSRVTTAEAEIRALTISPVAVEGNPQLLFAPTQDVLIWPLEEL